MSEQLDILKLVAASMPSRTTTAMVGENPLTKVIHSTKTRSDPNAVLVAQMQTLDEIFAALLTRAGKASHSEQVEGYMRMALRVQTQCVRTVQALATLGKPGHVSFVQANITTPPQPQGIVNEN